MLEQVKIDILSFIQEFDNETKCEISETLKIDSTNDLEIYSIRLTIKGEVAAYKIFMLSDVKSVDHIVMQMAGEVTDSKMRDETAMELLNIIAGMAISALPQAGDDSYYFIEAPDKEVYRQDISNGLVAPICNTLFSASQKISFFLTKDNG